MSIFGWVRDFIGIRKDAIETKKDKLEINRLQDEERERESIKRADLEDVKKYDPKTKKLLRKIAEEEQRKYVEMRDLLSMHFLNIWFMFVLIIIFLIIYLIRKLL